MNKKGQETSMGSMLLWILLGAALIIVLLILIGIFTGLIPKLLGVKFW